jgi:hypothetical protein
MAAASFERRDMHHNSEPTRKPEEVPLGGNRIVVLEAD